MLFFVFVGCFFVVVRFCIYFCVSNVVFLLSAVIFCCRMLLDVGFLLSDVGFCCCQMLFLLLSDFGFCCQMLVFCVSC